MDVHRAARVAGAAHGGQVLISEATERLVKGCYPDGVAAKDLGSHQLKDIPLPERIFQLDIDGLITDYPPPKTLGTSSSLPRPPTPLVGREEELAELAAVLASPEVRLVTLTGPGGTGKTRLGIAVAELTRDRFPDGVYFVPLAAVTTTEVMWTTIAEVLDVPPEGRMPPALFKHVAHRSGLLVLDNLEQLNGADDVVAELMTAAPKVVVLATSRRPLHVPGEHERPVMPLDLPQKGDVAAAPGTGAVRLFVQQAQMVLPTFRLSSDNTADVVAVCTRLDGLPLAIELAAARSKLLTPRALLATLTDALGIAATSRRGPSRQKTLRETIGWSYDLLDPEQQGFFRILGVFAGGADLDAISAVTDPASGQKEADPFNLVADLVDASLITITESTVGEPRVAMLETIRSYAVEALDAAGESDVVRDRHAQHYRQVARQLGPQLNGVEPLEARRRLETEHDNLREALAWLLQADPGDSGPTGQRPSLELCALLAPFWLNGGYLVEGRTWLEQVTAQYEKEDSMDLAACLSFLAQALFDQGHIDRGDRVIEQSVAMYRRLNDPDGLAAALIILGWTKMQYGDIAATRAVFEEAVEVAREATDNSHLARALCDLSLIEADANEVDRCLELQSAGLAAAAAVSNLRERSGAAQNVACGLLVIGRGGEACDLLHSIIPDMLRLQEPVMLMAYAEDYAAALAGAGDGERAARLLGAAEAMRTRYGTGRHRTQDEQVEHTLTKLGTLLPHSWRDAYRVGQHAAVEEVLADLHAEGMHIHH
jgi:predicted ATPase